MFLRHRISQRENRRRCIREDSGIIAVIKEMGMIKVEAGGERGEEREEERELRRIIMTDLGRMKGGVKEMKKNGITVIGEERGEIWG